MVCNNLWLLRTLLYVNPFRHGYFITVHGQQCYNHEFNASLVAITMDNEGWFIAMIPGSGELPMVVNDGWHLVMAYDELMVGWLVVVIIVVHG